MGSNSNNVPIIDLQDLPTLSKTILEACMSWGCFRVVNHSIPPKLLAEMKSTGMALHDLPAGIKHGNPDILFEGVGSSFGYSGMSSPARLVHEGIYLYDVASAESINEFCNKVEASPHQRETIDKYCKGINELVMKICKSITTGMGLHSDLLEGWRTQIRINKYNFTPENVGVIGAQSHSDMGFLSILQEDEEVGGLEIMDRESGEFVPSNPMPAGSLLVFMGDFATLWSNGRFHNLKHRVVFKKPVTRVSILFVLFGPQDRAVEAPTELVGPENPRLFNPILFDDYAKLRVTKIEAGEVLSMLRTNAKTSQSFEG